MLPRDDVRRRPIQTIAHQSRYVGRLDHKHGAPGWLRRAISAESLEGELLLVRWLESEEYVVWSPSARSFAFGLMAHASAAADCLAVLSIPAFDDALKFLLTMVCIRVYRLAVGRRKLSAALSSHVRHFTSWMGLVLLDKYWLLDLQV